MTLALLLVRLFALVSGLLARVATRLPVVVPLLVLRTLSRRPGGYTGPLLLICLTLALSVFAASAARTLDDHLVSQTYYRVGADVNLAELGTLAASEEPDVGSGGSSASNDPGSYRFLPVAEHLRLDGVNAAVWVSDLTALAQLGGRQRTGRLLGIDRLGIP